MGLWAHRPIGGMGGGSVRNRTWAYEPMSLWAYDPMSLWAYGSYLLARRDRVDQDDLEVSIPLRKPKHPPHLALGTYAYIDTLMHWYIDTLIHWYIDTLIHWCIDTLIHWCIDALIHWCIDALIHWYIDTLIHWCIDTLMHWTLNIWHWTLNVEHSTWIWKRGGGLEMSILGVWVCNGWQYTLADEHAIQAMRSHLGTISPHSPRCAISGRALRNSWRKSLCDCSSPFSLTLRCARPIKLWDKALSQMWC
jgi:hypothetical protein